MALFETFKKVLPYVVLPYFIKEVLLPFKGKIISDGILRGYSMVFGSGIKSNLKETYMAAKQNGRIIESFDPAKQTIETTWSKKTTKALIPTI